MGGREWCQKTHLPAPTAISLRKSLRFRKRPIQAGRDRKRKSLDQRETDRQTEPFPAPSLCLAPTSTHLILLSRLGRSRFREVPHLPRGHPAVPAPQPVLPDLGVPSSPGSSHSSAGQGALGLGDPGRAQGQGHDGPGSLARPGLSLQQVLQLSQEAEKQVPGEFPLSVSSRAPSPASPGRGLGRAGPETLGKSRSL